MITDPLPIAPDALRFLEALWIPGDVREVRIPRHDKWGHTASGYFATPETAAVAIESWDGKAAGLYVTLNPVNPALRGRAADRIVPDAKSATADVDIVRRRWLLVDVDPVRPAGISSTDDELAAALAVMKAAAADLRARGWPNPISGMSGNGYHALYPVDLPNDAESLALVHGVLAYLAETHNTPAATIDRTVDNAARISAILGTLKMKGDDLPGDRPHRRAELLKVPTPAEPVPPAALRALAPLAAPALRNSGSSTRADRMPAGWVTDLLDAAGVAYRLQPPDAAGIIWHNLERCPFHEDGAPWTCGVGEAPDGRASGHCMHNRGAGAGWQEFRDALGLGLAWPGIVDAQPAKPEPAAPADPGTEPAPPPPTLIVGIDAYRASVPASIPWVCRPLAYLGGVSLIAGPPKAGKSTLAAQMQRCRETGERLFGAWEVTTGPTLLVTEEGGVAVVHKAEGLHALDVLDRRSAAAAGLTFNGVLAAIREWGTTRPGGLVFIDTLAIWAGIVDENDAGQATRAIAAVTTTAQAANLAIVLVHHARKGGGDDGEAVRGSGAILATVDIGIELSRVSPGRDDRYLDIMGRVIQAERYELAFDRATSGYTLADQSRARLAAIESDLAGIPPDGSGLTRQELQALWKRDPRARAEQLVNVGRMRSEYVKSGRSYAWRYWSIPPAWTPEDRREG